MSGLFQKVSSQQNITLGAHILVIGLGVTLVGILICVFQPSQSVSFKAAWPSLTIGACWGIGMLFVAISLTKYGALLSQVTPLYNMNTLVTVAAALFIFSEWKDASLVKLGIGTVLIVAGGILVST